jgi:hypothetical protein
VTALARFALLLAAVASWRGGSRPVAVALTVIVMASAASTLPLSARAVFALYLVPPAASVWIAQRVAAGRGWPAVLAWVLLATWTWLAPPGSPWAIVRLVVGLASVAGQLAAVARIGRPRTLAQRAVVVLVAGDMVASLLALASAPWWLTQGQSVIVSSALIWTHRK